MIRNTIRFTCLLFISMLILSSCEMSPSQMSEQQAINPNVPIVSTVNQTTPNETQSQTTDTVSTDRQDQKVSHIQKTIEGKTIKLNIDVDVKEYPGREFGVYNAKPMQVDQEAWFTYFFPGIDRSQLTHYYTDWGEKYLRLSEVTDEVIQNTFGYIYGDIHNPEVETYYLINQSKFYYMIGMRSINLEEKCELTPDETTRKKAESLSDEIMSFAAGDRLFRTSCDIEQTENDKEEVYVGRYQRKIEDLPILFDQPIMGGADLPDPIKIDEGVVWVMNDKVVYASATVRDIELKEKAPVIPLEQALGTLELYADSVNAYSKDFADGKTDKSEFDIKDIELMYYPVAIQDADIAGTYAGQHAYATYRPVWCISSGQRDGTNFVFVMIIDAITGEVIG